MSAENETEQTLAKLKVPELKARCKALKIPNFSKLSKTDLIAKILAVRTDATATASTKLPNNDVDQHETAGQRPRPPSDTFTEAAKEPAVKERKKEPTKRKTVPKASNNSPDDADEGETIQKKPKGANALQQPDKAPECSGAAAGTAKTVPTVSVTRPILPASTSVTKQPMHNAPALSKTIPPVSPAVKSTSVKGVPKSLAKATPAVKAKFRPLAEVAPKEAPVAPPPPVVQLETVSLATPTDRMSHVEKHFLNGMFRQMHRYRAKPILKPPFPTHPSFPKSSPTGHLAFQGLHPDLYVKVQSDAFEVALRFWVARLHSSMQLGSSEAWSLQAGGIGLLGPDMSTWPPITGCVQIVSDIWAVTTKEDKVDINYLVIGEIGEVIGHSRNTSAKDEGLVGGCRLREDWKRYIGNGKRKSLISAVKSKDSYEFSGGISRVWRGGQTSHIKVKIAERAVLASCALNSFSGEKLTSIAMDAAWLGRPTALGYNPNASEGLDLYLPESSQVVSVHQPASLHSALAIVHRCSGYSEYVLAETGQVVGSEDEGVVSLWQSLLGCNEKGVEDSSAQEGFWKGWEGRLKKAE